MLVGTEPNPLGNVFVSNEIDEIEASMVRITEAFNQLKTGGADRASRPGRRTSSGTGRGL